MDPVIEDAKERLEAARAQLETAQSSYDGAVRDLEFDGICGGEPSRVKVKSLWRKGAELKGAKERVRGLELLVKNLEVGQRIVGETLRGVR